MLALRRARHCCPAEGIVIAVSVERLMNADEVARKRCANVLRARVDMAYRAFGQRVPVYVVVTQCDRLAGFEDFVCDSTEPALDRPLGVVFPASSDVGSEAWSAFFARGFEALVSQARRQSIERMPVRADSRRATQVYRFPSSLAELRVPLARFLEDAFASSPDLFESICLRGVNLTAVLSHGTPRAHRPGSSLSAAPPRERVCFMRGWQREVLLAERGLAHSRHVTPRRKSLRRQAAAALCVAFAVCASVALVCAYRYGAANANAAIRPAAELARVARAGIDVARPDTMLPVLDAARDLPCARAFDDLSGAWPKRVPLTREPHLEAQCRHAYRAALQATVLPYLLARTSAVLREGAGLPSAQYDALRLYLMLGHKAYYDRAAVYGWLAADAQHMALSAGERAAWLTHAAAWADVAASEPDAPLDEALIARARDRLRAQPEARRVFDEVVSALRNAGPAPLSVAEMAGPGAALVLYRANGGALSDGVFGGYTLGGARRYFALRDAAIARAQRESWVLGGVVAERPAARLTAEVDRLYAQGYIAAWDALLSDVALRPLPGADEGAAVATLLAGPQSPLSAYLLRAAKETTWAAGNADLPARTAPGRLEDVRRTVRRWLGGSAARAEQRGSLAGRFDEGSVALVERHFDALHRLVAIDAGGPSLLDQAQAQLKEVAVYLRAAAVARATGVSAPPDEPLMRLVREGGALPAPLGGMLQGLGEAGTAAVQSAERARIGERWRADVADFCHAAVDGRYPFVAQASVDSPPEDFARLFARGGLLDTFFQTNLQRYADTTTTPWRWRAKIAPPGMSAASLAAFERAAEIRRAFFPEQGKTMNVRFTLARQDMEAGLTSFALTLGGRTLSFARGASATTAFDWPDAGPAPVARIDYALATGEQPRPIEEHGAWSLFRLLDRGTLDALGPDRFRLTFALDGRRVLLDLAASSVVNPFALTALRSFRCPSRM
jgi:type VI secretion system protein ImpL